MSPSAYYLFLLIMIAVQMAIIFAVSYPIWKTLFAIAKWFDTKTRLTELEIEQRRAGTPAPLPSWATAPRPANDEDKYKPKM